MNIIMDTTETTNTEKEISLNKQQTATVMLSVQQVRLINFTKKLSKLMTVNECLFVHRICTLFWTDTPMVTNRLYFVHDQKMKQLIDYSVSLLY